MQDAKSAQFVSLFNGVFALAVTMARRGLIEKSDLEFLHRSMTKPLDAEEHASNEGLAQYQQLVEGLISTIGAELK